MESDRCVSVHLCPFSVCCFEDTGVGKDVGLFFKTFQLLSDSQRLFFRDRLHARPSAEGAVDLQPEQAEDV